MGDAMKPSTKATKNKGSWLAELWGEHSNILLVLLCSILLLQDVFGAHGLMAMRQSQRETARVRQEIKVLDDQNRQAEDRIRALETDPATIECIARAQGLARPGENVFKLPEPSGDSSDSAPGNAFDDADDPCFAPASPQTQNPQSSATPSPAP
jgi:cell division protein FtsB